jgi:tRNA threonylcarbamoyladenosine biosynthesis protein TsaB
VRILALDTCDARGGLALLQDSSVLHIEPHTTAEDYSIWLIPATARLLSSAKLTLGEIELYAAAAGPGSFTGVRVGLTAVKAWSEVFSTPIAAVSRLEALATRSTGSAPFVAATVDARRNQIFAALYGRDEATLTRVGDDQVIAPNEFLDWCAAQARSNRIDWVSTDASCVTSADLWRTREASGEMIEQVSAFLAPSIGQIGYRLAQQNKLSDALSLDANYVRRCDAELFRKGAARHGT